MAPIDYASAEGDEYHKKRHGEYFDHPGLTKAWGRYARQVYFPHVKKGDKFLEIGAGLGVNLTAIKDEVEVYAIEPAKIASDHCRSLGIKVFSTLDEISPGLRFDRILLRHVLEHVREPRALLCQLLDLLSPQGKLSIILPTESPFDPPVANELDHHLYCWNRKTISNLLADAGYQVLHTRIHWFNGRKIFLPIFNLLGVKAYALCMGFLGRLRRRSEIVVIAQRR